MLVTPGVRMTDVDLGDRRAGLLGALSRTLSGMPLGGLLGWWFNLPSEQARSLVLFGVLPSARLNCISAERYGQEPQRVASIVLLGNSAALVTLAAVLFWVL